MTRSRSMVLLATLCWAAGSVTACIDARETLDDPADAGGASGDGGVSMGDAAADGDGDQGGDGDGAGTGSSSSSGGGGSSGASSGGATGCESDQECARGIADFPCRTAKCALATGGCQYADKADGQACGDATKCVQERSCKAGECVATEVDCDDGKSCTLDKCLEGKGCQHSEAGANGTPCTDANDCTTGDACLGGKCIGKAKKCEPGDNPCVIMGCDPQGGDCKPFYSEDYIAAYPEMATPTCDDQSKCTTGDACAKGKCTGAPVACGEGEKDVCKLWTCQPAKGCLSAVLPGLKCDDGDPCTAYDRCQGDIFGASCKGDANDCDDGNPCTKDSCDQAAGLCRHATDTTASCDDGDACTEQDGCATGSCKGGAKNCDDGNLCTDDECLPGLDCRHFPNAGKCDDGDLCTAQSACKKGACVGGAQVKCDDGLECTIDSTVCDSKIGCSASPKKFGLTACGGGKGHCWYEGACVTPKCGNDVCDYGEPGKCKADCRAGGGRCDPKDASCMGKCEAEHCGPAAKACAGDAGCKTLRACLGGCKDLACRAACLGKAGADSQDRFDAIHRCSMAKCAKNAWQGINCSGSGASYNACLATCQTGYCYRFEALCGADAACTKLDDCVSNCEQADTSCITGCKAAASKTLIATWDDLVQCRTLHCDLIQ